MRFKGIGRFVAFAGLAAAFLMVPGRITGQSGAKAQGGDKVLAPADVQKLLPQAVYYKGQSAPAQRREGWRSRSSPRRHPES